MNASSPTPSDEALRLAREFVSAPDVRAQVKVEVAAGGMPLLADMIDEAVVMAREIIRLAELPLSEKRDTIQALPQYVKRYSENVPPSDKKYSSFADFINNATDDEKKAVYEEVMRKASERQNRQFGDVGEALVERLRIRARIRRNAQGRKSVEEGKPDRIADLLEEAASALSATERVLESMPTDAQIKAICWWMEWDYSDKAMRAEASDLYYAIKRATPESPRPEAAPKQE
jgi:hypothetical protein